MEDFRLPEGMVGLPTKIDIRTIEKAKAATVQIGIPGEVPNFSGVIVRDRYVVTCAHHNRLPGEILEITLEDGRLSKAVVRGTNRLTDTCVLEIVDRGAWPSVKLGFSNVLPPGYSVLVVGYPVSNEGTQLVLRTSSVTEKPEGGLPRRDSFSRTLFLECNDENIVTNLRGASGGGIFDSAGNLVGVLSSTNAAWTNPERIFHGEIWNTRVELIHKNWEDLVNGTEVTTVAQDLLNDLQPKLADLQSKIQALTAKPDK
ncbi:MAG: serine protease [Cyanobacteria bacterium P01_E01_bin.48]